MKKINTYKNNWITFILTSIPALAMMLIIFYFSSCDGDTSTNSSDTVVQCIISFMKSIPFFHFSKGEYYNLALHLSFPVRKMAHMMEFGMLFLCFVLALYSFIEHGIKKKYWRLIAFLLTVLYAVSDEFHQLFVVGREGRILDVMIDSLGALIIWLIIYRIDKRCDWQKHMNKME